MDKVVLKSNRLDSLFEFLADLDVSSKKKLIKRLQDSLKKKEPKNKKSTLADLAGSWKDERSAKEIIADIKSSSHLTRNINTFD